MAALVDSTSALSLDNSVMPPRGIVTLDEKIVPVCELDPSAYPKHLAYDRADVDVEGFRAKLRSLPPGFWEDENQPNQVRMKRPAHDAWGVKKIVFTFCDDYLQKVLDLPYALSEEWRQFVIPIYHALGIREEQVVRSLLANMPGGLNIPVHHDTGYWVKHCHRCHVALESGSEVNFSVGCTSDTMKKHLFPIGKIIELNNQAKHSVTNGMNSNRIHLIFDYVEEAYLESHPELNRHKLKPTDKIIQTRRSIDLPQEFGKRKTPTFIVIGAQKCGTTSVYEYLMQHGLATKGARRETHFFDWRWPESLANVKTESELKKHSKEAFDNYMEYFPYQALQKHSSVFTGESTPSYMLHSDIVIPRLKVVAPWVKIIVMLRNPTERAYSHFQMSTDANGNDEQLKVRGQSEYLGKSFLEVIRSEIDELNSLGITPDSTYEEFSSLYLKTRPLGHGGHSLVSRGLYHLQLIPWLQDFPEQMLIMELGELKGGKGNVQKTMDKVLSFLQLPQHDFEDLAAKNTRSYDRISEEAKEVLNTFYAPFNRKLFNLIGKEYDW